MLSGVDLICKFNETGSTLTLLDETKTDSRLFSSFDDNEKSRKIFLGRRDQKKEKFNPTAIDIDENETIVDFQFDDGSLERFFIELERHRPSKRTSILIHSQLIVINETDVDLEIILERKFDATRHVSPLKNRRRTTIDRFSMFFVSLRAEMNASLSSIRVEFESNFDKIVDLHLDDQRRTTVRIVFERRRRDNVLTICRQEIVLHSTDRVEEEEESKIVMKLDEGLLLRLIDTSKRRARIVFDCLIDKFDAKLTFERRSKRIRLDKSIGSIEVRRKRSFSRKRRSIVADHRTSPKRRTEKKFFVDVERRTIVEIRCRSASLLC